MSVEKFLKEMESFLDKSDIDGCVPGHLGRTQSKKLIRIVRELEKEVNRYTRNFPSSINCLKRCDELAGE